MASFSLDDIRAAADKKYASTDITLAEGRVCKLINALRLPKETRNELGKIQDRLDSSEKDENGNPTGDEVDHVEVFSNAIRLVAEHPHMADELLAQVDGDLAVLVTIFEEYTKGTEAGEA